MADTLETTSEKLTTALTGIAGKNRNIMAATIVNQQGLIVAEYKLSEGDEFETNALSAIGLELASKATVLIENYIKGMDLTRVSLDSPTYTIQIFPSSDHKLTLIVAKSPERPGLMKKLFSREEKKEERLIEDLKKIFDYL